MLERLVGHAYYYFLGEYLRYNQIVITLKDQEKTNLIAPYGTFAYKRMPFSLCNTLSKFQRCMMSIFSNKAKKFIELFMDDFSIFSYSFDNYLSNLSLAL